MTEYAKGKEQILAQAMEVARELTRPEEDLNLWWAEDRKGEFIVAEAQSARYARGVLDFTNDSIEDHPLLNEVRTVHQDQLRGLIEQVLEKARTPKPRR